MQNFANRNGDGRCVAILLAIMAAVLAPAAQAKEGYYSGRISNIWVSGSGEVMAELTPAPSEQDFSCPSAVRFGELAGQGVDRIRYLNLSEALSTNAGVSIHLSDRTSSSGDNYCQATHVRRHQPSASPTTQPTDPNPTNPPREYYGALAVGEWLEDGIYYGTATDEPSLEEASQAALDDCGHSTCSVRRRIVSGECVLVYGSGVDELLYWISGPRGRLDQMRQEILGACRSEVSDPSSCVRVVEACNSGTAGIAPVQSPGMGMMHSPDSPLGASRRIQEP